MKNFRSAFLSLRVRGALASTLAGILLTTPVFATTATTSLAISATVLSVCAVAATPMAFGNYSATSGTPDDATAIITATCTSGTPYTIALDAGIGASATFATRKMTASSNTLSYSIYTNSTHTTVWGNGTSSTSTQGATAGLIPDTYTAYGRIPVSQQSPTGAYVDTVTVTLTY